jgi:NAD(P)-dependent dehydrogenase (short-subunit alcohol dehydrogenase family)
MSEQPRLANAIAIVTGAASGIGAGIAAAFVRNGARVVVADLSAEAVEASSRAIDATGERATGMVLDVRDPASFEAMLDATQARFGSVNVLVNSAGILARHDFFEVTPTDWDALMDVNLKGMFFCTQAAARRMRENGGGAVINICSTNAVNATPIAPHYTASKGGVKSLTKASAHALARYGIRVNAIGPGSTYTPPNKARLDDPDGYRAVTSRIPLGRVAQPSDMGNAAVFLASEEASYITGITLWVDGGKLTT